MRRYKDIMGLQIPILHTVGFQIRPNSPFLNGVRGNRHFSLFLEALAPRRAFNARSIFHFSLFVSLLLLFAPCSVSAKEKKEKKPKQEKLITLQKNARQALKNRSGQDAARDALLGALANLDMGNKQKAKVYYTAALLEQSLNGVENQKAWLKQPYDTAKFFNKLGDMYAQLRLCDSVDFVPDAKGKVHQRMQKKTNALRLKHRRNIYMGGKYFLTKQNYAAAYPFLDYYCSYKGREVKKGQEVPDTLLPQAMLWATLSAFLSDNSLGAVKHADAAIAFADPATAEILYEYKVRSFAKLGNDSAWVAALKQGIRQYPQHDYFFVQLADWYQSRRLFNEERNLADQLLERSGRRPIYYYAKSKSFLAEDDFEACIAYADTCISLQQDFVDAYYNKGLAYLNMAVIVQETSCKDAKDPQYLEDKLRAQELFRQARPCLEMVRKLQPDRQERWASPLYRIYLNLNLGDEFNEIDKLLNPKG